MNSNILFDAIEGRHLNMIKYIISLYKIDLKECFVLMLIFISFKLIFSYELILRANIFGFHEIEDYLKQLMEEKTHEKFDEQILELHLSSSS